jgi:transcriptional regulator with XRE-family HTH domain
MPRPNKPREVLAEEHVARRIVAERDARGWTNDGLAARMTAVGCPMSGSAIFKIEKAQPRRRIVVDELVAFATVFGITVEDMLMPPEVAQREIIQGLITQREWARKEAAEAVALFRQRQQELEQYVENNPDAREALEQVDELRTLWQMDEDLWKAADLFGEHFGNG